MKERVEELKPGYNPEHNAFLCADGLVLTGVHAETAECTIHGCVIHSPTDHPMKDFEQIWRQDRGIMERVCEHGVGHPDPDGLKWLVRNGSVAPDFVHGCDGCCAGSYDWVKYAR
jgi:hypothetical protein